MIDWPHAPVHRFTNTGIFFVTGSTYLKRHHYRDRQSLDAFSDMFFGLAREHSISLQAWTMFSNHYHLVADCAGEALRGSCGGGLSVVFCFVVREERFIVVRPLGAFVQDRSSECRRRL